MHVLTRLIPFALSVAVACGDKSDDTGAMTTTAGPETGDTSGDGTTSPSTPTTGEPGTTNGPSTTNDPSTSNGPSTTVEPDTTSEPVGETGDTSGESTTAPAGCDGDAPRVRFETTLGDMVVQLDAVNMPITVANFIHYVETGFYSDTIFHRVVNDFVIQGGGFTADLMEKPTDPPIVLETSPAVKHVDGAISMARTMDPNSATSQFFICDGPQDFLDGQYAAFGVLVEGFDVLATIASVPTGNEGPYMDVPVEDVVVLSATCE